MSNDEAPAAPVPEGIARIEGFVAGLGWALAACEGADTLAGARELIQAQGDARQRGLERMDRAPIGAPDKRLEGKVDECDEYSEYEWSPGQVARGWTGAVEVFIRGQVRKAKTGDGGGLLFTDCVMPEQNICCDPELVVAWRPIDKSD